MVFVVLPFDAVCNNGISYAIPDLCGSKSIVHIQQRVGLGHGYGGTQGAKIFSSLCSFDLTGDVEEVLETCAFQS